MAFGVLVHQTIEDIHRYFINNRDATELPTPNFITDRIKENYQVLGQQTAHQLSKTSLATAQEQVEQYWIKLPDIARAVTDTEVPLTLPNQKTLEDRTYSIHGVVDLAVNAATGVHLYDIKTHSSDTVSANAAHYEQQLNVYAHIWQNTHGTSLSGTSIIATKLPDPQMPANLAAWNPLVPLTFNVDAVAATIRGFGAVVDQIESRQFTPKPLAGLCSADPNTYPGKNFAQYVCTRCDGRFSCSSYAAYLLEHPKDKENNTFTLQPIDAEQDPSELGNVAMNPACKDAFLNDQYVKEFIDYLVELVSGNQPINHQYQVEAVNQHFMPNQVGQIVRFDLLEDAFNGYVWKTQNYANNAAALNSIAINLRNALQTRNEIDLYNAALDCLAWGAGSMAFKLFTANRAWLSLRKKQTLLVDLFDKSFQQLSHPCPNINGFKSGHYRMNSGMTKIYALTYDDFIIYDSRVAAALGRFVTQYSSANSLGGIPTYLSFGWTGPKKRNPSIGGYRFPRLNNNSLKHAEWNVKANWLLTAVVDRFFDDQGQGGFWDCNNRQECLRRLEAALFMIGYDVSMNPPAIPVNAQMPDAPIAEDYIVDANDEEDEEIATPLNPLHGMVSLTTLWDIRIRQGCRSQPESDLLDGWVPTSHDFTTALNAYYEYRLTNPIQSTCKGFKSFMQANGIPVGTKCYVQNRNEFNLNEEETNRIQNFYESGENGAIKKDSLVFLNKYRDQVINNQDWLNFPKYLMCTYLVGVLADYKNAHRRQILQALQYAGTPNAADAIITVGRSFGLHFGFLDENYYPTQLFNSYFLTTEPLTKWINNIIP